MFIHQDKNTKEMTPYQSMADIARNTEITIGQLKHHFSVCKKTEWETDTFRIEKKERVISKKKKPRGNSKYGFE